MCASWNKKMRTISVGYLRFIAEVWIWKCKLWDFVSPSPVTPTPRPYPDYNKLPDFHYLPSTKTPTSGSKPDDYQPRAQLKQMFQEGKLKAGDKKAIRVFWKIHCFRKACCRLYGASKWHWIAESQQEKEADETLPESGTSRYGRKRTQFLRENYVPWHNIHVEM